MSESGRNLPSLLCFLLLAALAGLAGAMSVPGAWYADALTPGWAASGSRILWITGGCLVLVALAGWRVWVNRVLPGAGSALFLWAVQLLAAVGWGIVLFDLHRPGWALPVIALLGLSVLASVVMFSRVSRPAQLLMLPWLGWVSYLGLLTLMIWRMN